MTGNPQSSLAREAGARTMIIVSDPNAEAFYLRMGARRAGQRDAIVALQGIGEAGTPQCLGVQALGRQEEDREIRGRRRLHVLLVDGYEGRVGAVLLPGAQRCGVHRV